MRLINRCRLIFVLWLGFLLSGCNEPDMGSFTPGLTDTCRGYPQFLARTGLGSRVALDTRQRGFTGLRVLHPENGRSWQHPSWDDAGHVGAMARDRQGNVYLTPAPEVSLTENPPELQNRIYKVDYKSAEMQLWMTLPGEPSLSNPFGAMGMFYDCDTDSLYVSSVAESSPREVKGVIYRINPGTKEIVSQLDAVDAIGVGVFNTSDHKRLYFGSARSSDVYSAALDVNGDFTTDVKHEFALAGLPGGDTTNVRKFEFLPKRGEENVYLMRLKELEFGFRLTTENNPGKQMYIFRYDGIKNTWQFIQTVAEANR
uniref:Phytase-like domain-containing protein n=1 Tax=uncultured Thiotrichaceae bacterium TaxID=298394 RepID=A0A6S6UA76_9GAMM|nr:MAG: Unknown protein [uncultured Thiotrichaceae bacterium]